MEKIHQFRSGEKVTYETKNLLFFLFLHYLFEQLNYIDLLNLLT